MEVVGSVVVGSNRFVINLLINRALAVFWSPCGNPALTRLVVNITMNLQMLQECYKNKNELQAALQYYGDKPIIGLQFEDELAQKENFSKTLNVEVRLVFHYFSSSIIKFSDNSKTKIAKLHV